jgi:O-antigen/teichoic acid export membrane protein
MPRTRPSLATRLLQGVHGKFRRDVMWSVTGLAVMGVCGVLLNILVGCFYDAAALGVFNQVFAVYVLFSQFAVGGIHYSTLQAIAPHAEDRASHPALLIGALVPTALLALAAATVFYGSRYAVGGLLQSPQVATGIAWAVPGLFFFAINKVLLAALNGLRRMKEFALLQATRPAVMIATLLAVALLRYPAARLPLVFSIAETVVFLAALVVLRRHLAGSLAGCTYWMRRHALFGAQSFFSGVLIELNARVDVLMLGYFVSDRLVGLYSFAAILAEGFYQLLVVLRNNVNPILAQGLASQRLEELRQKIRRGRAMTYMLMFAVGTAAVALFPVGPYLLSTAREFAASWLPFAILIGGITLGAGYVPFGGVLLQAGRPGMHTVMTLAVVLAHIAGNLALIPIYGPLGAAVATGFSFVFSAMMLQLFAFRLIGLRI